MSATTDNGATVELKLTTTGVVWLAGLEAQGSDHLRVRLRDDGLGVIPVLTPGTALECTMRSEDGRYYVTGTVLEQRGPLVWLSLPAMWRKDERREFARQSGGFAVKYSSEEARGIAHCVDISAGGVKIRVKQEMTVRTHVDLLFTLPGEALPVRVRGLFSTANRPSPKRTGSTSALNSSTSSSATPPASRVTPAANIEPNGVASSCPRRRTLGRRPPSPGIPFRGKSIADATPAANPRRNGRAMRAPSSR